MKALLLMVLPSLWLVSCTGYEELTVSRSGNYSRTRLVKLGGTASQRSANGSSIVTDDQTSFRDATVAITSLASTAALKSVSNARQATAQQANARPPTVVMPTVDPATGTVLTPQVIPPPPAVIPNY